MLLAAFAAFAWFALPGLDEAQTTGSGSGIVQRIDLEEGTVTLQHGPVPALNMTPMTMVFPVQEKGQVLRLQPMQQVEFQVSYDRKGYLITDIR